MNNAILNKLKKGESETAEFKTTFNDDLIISLVAFANTKGGTIFVGVDDKRKITGITLGKETLQNWINEIKVKTQPSIVPTIEVHNQKEKQIVSISVQEYPVKPLSFKGRYYKRINNSNHQLTTNEIADAYLQSMQYSWDAYPSPKSNITDINKAKVLRFITKVNNAGRFRLPENTEQALVKLKILNGGVPTNAAMILFSKSNLLYNVHIGRFKTPRELLPIK